MNSSFLQGLSDDWKSKHARLMTESYRHFFHKELVPDLIPNSSSENLFDTLFDSPFVLLSHGTEADPVLNFGNETALRLWEMTWDELVRMPSRLTAEPMEREARAQFIHQVQTHGCVDNYSGIRISKSGRRFKIENAKVWNLIDQVGKIHGQAAYFASWIFLP